MIVDVLLFVSKRASVVTAALMCLAAVRLLHAALAGAPVPAVPLELRIAVGS